MLTDPDNERIKKIMARLGYAPNADTRTVAFDDGTTVDGLCFECGSGTAPPRVD